MTRLTPRQGAALTATIDAIVESHASSAARLPRVTETLEAKETANRHAAARAALSHIEHVLKVAAQAGEGGASPAQSLLAAARAEINEEPPEADDVGEPC